MNYILSILMLMSGCLFSQSVFTDNFNSFGFKVDGNTYALYEFKNKSAGADTVNSNNLTATGFSANFADELVAGVSPLIYGDSVLSFNGSSEYFLGGTGTFEFGTGDKSIEGIFYLPNTTIGTNNVIVSKTFNTGATNDHYVLYVIPTTDKLRFKTSDNNNPAVTLDYNMDVADGSWHYFVARRWGDSLSVSVDGGTELKGKYAGTGEDVTNAAVNFAIGTQHSLGNYFSGRLAGIKLTSAKVTEKQSRESYALPLNWIATNGNLVRDLSSPDWFLTAYTDTIGVPLPDATLGASQEWVFDVKSKDADGSGSTNWWIGKKREPKTVVKTVNCGASFGNDKVYFGDGFALSSDTLWVAFSDTASVDNIVLKKESHHLIRNVNRWITW